MLRRRLGLTWGSAAWAVVALSGCTTGTALRKEAETIQLQLNRAREVGAYRCSPGELARAEAHLEFLQTELHQGNAVRAAQHRDQAKTALVTVLKKAEGCAPVDRDGDGVPDQDDACPDTPGVVALRGCPDKDGDGIADGVDKCPDVPEDLDQNEDEDGCPEDEDRDGDSVFDADDQCPDNPGPVENKGCPFGDRDGDGIMDDKDQCPDQAEDKDTWEDEDGCPDPDNDADGILDANDKCPMQPETANGHEDDDGCPDVKLDLVQIKDTKIEISERVFFATGRAQIKSVSFEVLNQVAEALKTFPKIHLVVEGHTDSVGAKITNQRLSQKRAESVREYLIGQGIGAERLVAVGFGEEKPIESNRTRKGRERNRRVEFTITQR